VIAQNPGATPIQMPDPNTHESQLLARREGNVPIPTRSLFDRFGMHLLFLILLMKYLLLNTYACYLHRAIVIPGVFEMDTPSNTCLKYHSSPNSVLYLSELPCFTVARIEVIVGGPNMQSVWDQKKDRVLRNPGIERGRWTYEVSERDRDCEILRWSAKRVSEGRTIDPEEHAEVYVYFPLKNVVIYYQGPWRGVKEFLPLLDTVRIDNKRSIHPRRGG